MAKAARKTMKTMSQPERVLKHLQRRPLNPIYAINNLGVYRLSSVIQTLRQRGHDIVTEQTSVKNGYGEVSNVARYVLMG